MPQDIYGNDIFKSKQQYVFTQQHNCHQQCLLQMSIQLWCNKFHFYSHCNISLEKYLKSRGLVGGGARGAIAPPTFLDLLNKYRFLPKDSNLFISTSTPKIFQHPQSQNADEGPVSHYSPTFITYMQFCQFISLVPTEIFG